MKLKKWKESNHKKKGIILFTILSLFLIVGVFFYQSFAVFQVSQNQNLIEGNIGSLGDIEFAYYLDGTIVPTAPEKNENYTFDDKESSCTNGATINWNYQVWAPLVLNLKETKTKCNLKFKTEYSEAILEGAVPELKESLVPIIIEENTGVVKKADIKSEWYRYGEQKWANAVILREGKTDTYQPGEVISEDNIESYFVWIPRYRYLLWNGEKETNEYKDVVSLGEITNVMEKSELNKQIPIRIEFENKNTPTSKNTTKGEYLTHPAFTTFDTNGLWVGKFETGYKGAKSSTEAGNNENTNTVDTTKVIIKPNVYSWRNINVSNAFNTSLEYKRELESHMMKNTEWGAVAYLTNSKYGRCKDNECEEVRINNNESYITGYSAKKAPTCGYTASNEDCNKYGGPTTIEVLEDTDAASYYIKASTKSSTTGNYTGIYDMAGGAWEYVMGVMKAKEDNQNPATGPNETYNSGFTGPYSNDTGINENGLTWPDKTYYDLYEYNTSDSQYQNGNLGDATKEFGPFYSVVFPKTSGNGSTRYVGSYNAAGAYFVTNQNPWFRRGGLFTDGTDTGVNDFERASGGEGSTSSFRIVLAP